MKPGDYSRPAARDGEAERGRGLWRTPAARGAILLLAVIAGGAWPGGCSKDDPRLKAYVALSPLAIVLPADKVRPAAEYYASLRTNAVVLSGEGEGMMPLYAPGTLVVVEHAPYASLKEGMSAVFRDTDGKRITHYLVALMPDGWTTRGLGQKEEDPSPMTEANYLGVVVMAFAPEKTPPPN